jgi:hypothetical protein
VSEELAAFVRARLDEDEATALAALVGPWHVDRHPTQGLRIMDVAGLVVTWTPGFYERGDRDASYIARYDPARALRSIAAKRAVLARHRPRPLGQWPVCANCRPVDPEYPDDTTSARWPCPDLRDLASIWSDHPDYRPEWSPAAA